MTLLSAVSTKSICSLTLLSADELTSKGWKSSPSLSLIGLVWESYIAKLPDVNPLSVVVTMASI